MEPDAILNSLDDAILTVDERGTVIFLNDAATRVFGCPRAQAVGQPVGRFTALADAVAQLNLGDVAPGAAPVSRSLSLQPPGATEARLLGALVTCAGVHECTHYTAVIRDVTLHQQMEKAVYDARKMQAIGALAGGIAHDFNNILTAVISQIDLALHAPELPESLRQNLLYAQTSARRGAELVSKLQTFSRKGTPTFGPVDVTAVVDQVVFMLKRSIDPRIELRWLPPGGNLWLARADAAQVTQALLNLGLNARDAMPRGGRLTFTARNASVAGPDARPPRKAGDFVQLTVADTGHGMSPGALSRVFEPYFSTKDPSRGPGLGLTITSAVVAEHGGWMEAESREGQGSQFHVFLPRSLESAREARATPAPDPKALEGRERILVVDDEELVRMVTKAVLAYRGYDVLEAEDGQDAVEKFSSASPKIDLVLMDVHMPRLNGHDALRRIREIEPNARVVLVSGGVHDGASDPSTGQEGVAFLHKPFENQELARVVRELLDARRS